MEEQRTVRRTQLEQASRGDNDALSSMLVEYLPRIRAFIRLRMNADLRARECSADLVQSVCVELLRGQEGFEYRDEPQLRSWLFTAALNKVREKQRFHGRDRRNIRRESPIGSAGDSPVADPDVADPDVAGPDVAGPDASEPYMNLATPSQAAMGAEFLARMDAAFDQLPEHYREVLTLARIAELPHVEIAKRMDRSVGAVRQILGRALVSLADLLEDP